MLNQRPSTDSIRGTRIAVEQLVSLREAGCNNVVESIVNDSKTKAESERAKIKEIAAAVQRLKNYVAYQRKLAEKLNGLVRAVDEGGPYEPAPGSILAMTYAFLELLKLPKWFADTEKLARFVELYDPENTAGVPDLQFQPTTTEAQRVLEKHLGHQPWTFRNVSQLLHDLEQEKKTLKTDH